MATRINNLLLAVLLLTAMAISEPTFTAGPSYAVDTAGIKLSFTVSESTDVDVAVVEIATGKIIRHLAGGTIGGNSTPSAPLVAGLSQSIIWNGADDKGVWAANKAISFKVRLGVRPKLHKTLKFEVPTTRYFNLKVIPRSPLYDVQTDTFISLNAYKFHDNYKDSSLYPTTTGMDMSVNDETDEIMLKLASRDGSLTPIVKYNGLTSDTGKIQQFNISGANSLSDTSPTGAPIPYEPRMYYGEQFYGRDGKYIYHDEMFRYKLLYRYNAADGTPAPFASTGVNYIKSRGFMGSGQIELPFRGRGGCEAPDGSIYYGTFADTSNQKWWASTDGTKQIGYVIRKWDSNGNLINKDLIRTFTDIGMGVNVDMQGNIYVGMLLKPKGDTVPPEIRQQLTGDRAGLYPFAAGWYGSIVKFKPTGGTVYHNNATGTYMMAPGINMAVTGQEWVYYGASCQNSFFGHYFGNRTPCICFTPRFDVDRFGRVIFPDVMKNEYICLDGNKNIMFKIHNRDFLKDSVKVGTGAIVQATDNGMYISDGTNNQVLCFSWVAAAEQSVSVPALSTDRENRSVLAKTLNATATPNPFSKTISIAVMSENSKSKLSVAIYDISGRLVRSLNASQILGKMAIYNWDGQDKTGSQLRNGFYFYRVRLNGEEVSGRLTLLR